MHGGGGTEEGSESRIGMRILYFSVGIYVVTSGAAITQRSFLVSKW
jgi:hypothetical protein